MKPLPPCGKCPRRCAVPNCHDPTVCGDWAAYQDALTAWRSDYDAARRERHDMRAVKRRIVELNRKKEKKRYAKNEQQ